MQQMFAVGQIGCGIYLCILSILDIWMRKVPAALVLAGAAAAVAVRINQGEVLDILSLAGAAVGVVFLIVSKLTEEGFGYGDSLVILVMGIYLGFWNLLGVLVGAFLLSSLFAVACLIKRKLDRRVSYPFIPFLLISYCMWMCWGGI